MASASASRAVRSTGAARTTVEKNSATMAEKRMMAGIDR